MRRCAFGRTWLRYLFFIDYFSFSSHFFLFKRSSEHLKQPVFTQKQLVERFRRKTKIPICLKIVLTDLMRKGDIQTLADFQAGKPAKNSSTTTDWLWWGMDVFVAKPMKWALGMGEPKVEDKWTFDESSVQFVHIPALKVSSYSLTSVHHLRVKRINRKMCFAPDLQVETYTYKLRDLNRMLPYLLQN